MAVDPCEDCGLMKYKPPVFAAGLSALACWTFLELGLGTGLEARITSTALAAGWGELVLVDDPWDPTRLERR
jgi:hypothetical protein